MYRLLMMLSLTRSLRYTKMQFPERFIQNVVLFRSDNDIIDNTVPPIRPTSKSYFHSGDRYCNDCVHFLGDQFSGKCGMYPFVSKAKTNTHFVLDLDIDYEPCNDVRKDNNKCGKLGRYFEEDT